MKGKVEEVELPVEKVDVIISEWMGYCLLYEAMLDTVLFARDKWLTPEGIMLPDRAVMYMSSIEDGEYKEEKIHFWDNVYGVNMGCIKKWAMLEPLVDVVHKNQVNSDACPILDIDLKTVKIQDLDFASKYTINIKRNDKIHAMIIWFDTHFSFGNPPNKLTTSKKKRERERISLRVLFSLN